jgi:hypothetical protein
MTGHVEPLSRHLGRIPLVGRPRGLPPSLVLLTHTGAVGAPHPQMPPADLGNQNCLPSFGAEMCSNKDHAAFTLGSGYSDSGGVKRRSDRHRAQQLSAASSMWSPPSASSPGAHPLTNRRWSSEQHWPLRERFEGPHAKLARLAKESSPSPGVAVSGCILTELTCSHVTPQSPTNQIPPAPHSEPCSSDNVALITSGSTAGGRSRIGTSCPGALCEQSPTGTSPAIIASPCPSSTPDTPSAESLSVCQDATVGSSRSTSRPPPEQCVQSPRRIHGRRHAVSPSHAASWSDFQSLHARSEPDRDTIPSPRHEPTQDRTDTS